MSEPKSKRCLSCGQPLAVDCCSTYIQETDAPAPTSPKDWISGSKSVYWGRWKEEWPTSILQDLQRWGDSNCCRFLLVSEFDDQQGTVSSKNAEYYLSLYIAPKPNRRETGLCLFSVTNRDAGFKKFGSWFEGFLAGRGLTPSSWTGVF